MDDNVRTGLPEARSGSVALSLSLLVVAIVTVFVANLWRPLVFGRSRLIFSAP